MVELDEVGEMGEVGEDAAFSFLATRTHFILYQAKDSTPIAFRFRDIRPSNRAY